MVMSLLIFFGAIFAFTKWNAENGAERILFTYKEQSYVENVAKKTTPLRFAGVVLFTLFFEVAYFLFEKHGDRTASAVFSAMGYASTLTLKFWIGSMYYRDLNDLSSSDRREIKTAFLVEALLGAWCMGLPLYLIYGRLG